MSLGTAMGVWTLLVALAFPGILSHRQDRAASRTPISADGSDEPRGWWLKRTVPFEDRQIQVLYLATDGTDPPPLPPGMRSFPEEGEAAVSPSLARELGESARLTTVFPYDPVATVRPEGLVAPDELFAVVVQGSALLRSEGLPLRGYGMSGRPEVDIAAGDLRLIGFAFLALVGVPLAVFFAITARLSASTRDRRLAALRLLGMSRGMTQGVNAFESATAALAGAIAGLLAYHLTQGALASLGLGGLVWFVEDGRLSLGSILLTLVGVPLLAVSVGIVGSRHAVASALEVRRHTPAAPAPLWRLIPFGVGLAVLTGLLIATLTSPEGGLRRPAPTIMMAAMLCTAVGVVVGFPVITTSIAGMIGSAARTTWMLLGTRRLQFEPSSGSRVVAGLVVVVFGMGFATGLQRDAQASASPLGKHEYYALQARDIPSSQRTKAMDVDGVNAVNVVLASAPPPPGQAGATIGFLGCSDLEVFIEKEIANCVDGQPYRLVPSEAHLFETPAAGTRFDFPLRDRGKVLRARVPEESLELPSQEYINLGITMMLPPEDLSGGRIPRTADIYLASATDVDAVTSVVAGVFAIAPLAELRLLNDDLVKRHQSLVFQGLLNAALLLGIIVGMIAFVVAALDRAVERRANLVSLRIVGVSASTLRAAQCVQVVLPLLVGAIIAILAGQVAEQVTVGVGGFASGWRPSGLLFSLGFSAVAIAAAVIATLPAIGGQIDVALIRRE
ncbi:MAG: hypothetical protein M3323_13995 [Actinomycetota bacterium]|nr:hypothetical protein [Actinomycetota bacterium]